MTLQFEPEPHHEFLRVIEPAHSLNLDLEKIIADRKLTDPIRSILSLDEVSLWTDKLNLKRPKIGSGFGWHQDSPYWIHDSEDVETLPNVYICLDDADESNGCFSVIKGSHKEGCLPGTFDNSQLGGFYTDQNSFNIDDSVDLIIQNLHQTLTKLEISYSNFSFRNLLKIASMPNLKVLNVESLPTKKKMELLKTLPNLSLSNSFDRKKGCIGRINEPCFCWSLCIAFPYHSCDHQLNGFWDIKTKFCYY